MPHDKISLTILAGGESTRMGVHKGNLTMDNKTFVDHIIYNIGYLFSQVNVIDNGKQITRIPGVNYHHDFLKIRSKSSLLGIHSALYYSATPKTFILGCDTPLVNTDVIKYILEHQRQGDIIVPMAEGRFQPLYGIYDKLILPRVEETLLKDLHKILIILDEFNTYYIPEEKLKAIDPSLKFIKNFNSYTDYLNHLNKNP